MPTLSLPDLAPLAGLLVLLELGVGTLVVSAALDLAGGAGRGFAGTTALICAAIMGVDLLLLSQTSDIGALLRAPVDAGAVASFAHWAVAFSIACTVDALFAAVGTEVARRLVGGATSVVGVVALVSVAVALAPGVGGAGPALLVLLPAALLGGGALAGMLLGHWYLVTPSLSFRPLRLAIYVVFAAVVVDGGVVAASLLTAAPARRSAVVAGDQAVLFWLLVVGAGIVFTAAVNGFTLYFARLRANQPATAMLYVLIISVVMALVPAQLIFFLTGVPV
ncbi:MAG: hypothetical protein ACYDAC_03060 [Candidatus Dormibacteria bacterium]